MSSKVTYVLNLTVRDSEIDFINVSCWGNENHILELNDKLNIGSIVEIKSPQIKLKLNNNTNNKTNDYDDLYRPWTPSKYELVINDQSSFIGVASLDDNLPFDYDNLFSLPIREHSDYYKLQDIIINGKAIDQQHINLLFAIKKVVFCFHLKIKFDFKLIFFLNFR